MGKAKAAVFPEPVSAKPMMSLPARGTMQSLVTQPGESSDLAER